MIASPALRRWLSMALTAAILIVVLSVLALQSRSPDRARANADTEKKESTRSWPLYGGTVSRNLVNLTEKGMPTEWNVENGTNIKWSVPLGSLAYGGPVIAGGRIYIGTNNDVPRDPKITGDKGVMMCLDEKTGDLLWQAVHDKLPAGRVNDWPNEGICSSPVVEGDRLYYVSNRCEVICADVHGMANGNQGVTDEKHKGPKDADIIWRLDMIGKLNVFPHNLATCSPLIVGDTLYVITSNGVDEGHINIPSPNAPSFLAIDKKTGAVKWKDNSPGKDIMHGQWSNPVYAEAGGKKMIIFPGGDGWVRAFNPEDGKLLWKFDCNPKDSKYVLGGAGTRNDFVSTPVIWENKLYIGVGQDPEHKKGVGHLWCIDITREPKNADKDLSPASKPGAKKGDPPQTIFDPKDPANKDSGLVWHYGGLAPRGAARNYVFGRTLSTCAIHEGLLYEAEFDGTVHCLDARTGKVYWTHDLQADTWSSPYWVDGKIYIGNESGEMNIFAHGKEKKLIKTIEVADRIRATPVAVNGVLYVITEGPCKLWAIKK